MITFWKKVYVSLLIPRLSVSRCSKPLGKCFLHKKTFSSIEMFAGTSKGNSNKASVSASRDFSESGYTEVLPSPKKSENDKKEYKVIQLDNGMKALLIADLASDDAPDFDSSDGTDGSESEDVSSDEMTGTQTGSCDPAFDASEEEKIVHPREEKLAALGLCVGVGSFSDPWEIQGMAHFLEHMVFMGSEKYPKENDFDAFIKKRGGSDNAETDCETTTFYFECQDKHLKEAIDKFSQFFISPLMMRDAMTREREAIESEFQMGVTCDENRREQLLASWAQPKSPIRKFPWGNLKTLRDNLSDDKLYEAVHEFWARHYSADRMTLAVQARLPIEILEPWIRESFSDVKNNHLPSDNFREFAGKVFNTPEFRKMYYVKAVKDMYEVELTWALPSMLHKYHSKPVTYIEELIGHEGSGSLLSYLRKKVWAVAISAGCAEDGFSNNSMYTLFVITIVLTEEGSTHLREVLDAVFGYIKMLQNTGPSERFYQELQTIEETKFKFAEEEPADEYVEMLATNMQFYPPEDYITGPKLFFKYDPEVIMDCLNALKPEDVNIMVSCKEAGKKFDQVEPWFQTEYSVHDIPNDWIETWSKSIPNICFKMPDPNIFLTTNFELLPFSEENDEQKILYPVKIQQNDLSEVWYRRDVKFKLPQAFFYIYLVSPMALSTAKNAALLGLYTEILQQMLTEKLYPAHVADLTCQVYPGDKGLVLKFKGYNQKLHLVLETVVNCMTKFVSNLSANLFNALKAIQLRNYYNTFLKPDKLGRDVRMSIVLQKYFNSVDRHTALADVTMPVLKEFAQKFIKQLYIQSLFQGNLTQKQAKFVCNRVVEILKFGPLSPDTFPEIRVHQIPLGDYYCRVKSFNLDDTNSMVTNYYQSRTFDLKNYCIVELIMMLMEEPVFDILRTKEQLGYHVYSTLRYTFGVIGFSVTVNCQAVKHSVEHVDSRIEAFLQKFVKMLKTTQEKELAEVRSALIKLKELSDVHLKEEVNRNWEEIVSREYMFDRQQREIACLEKINMPEIRKWFLQHVMCGNKNNLRKLSVQVVGSSGGQKTVSQEDTHEDKPAVHISKIRRHSKERPHTSDASTDTIPTNSPSESQFTIEFITEDEEQKKKKKNQTKHFISNIEEFKRNLELYPIVRISKQ